MVDMLLIVNQRKISGLMILLLILVCTGCATTPTDNSSAPEIPNNGDISLEPKNNLTQQQVKGLPPGKARFFPCTLWPPTGSGIEKLKLFSFWNRECVSGLAEGDGIGIFSDSDSPRDSPNYYYGSTRRGKTAGDSTMIVVEHEFNGLIENGVYKLGCLTYKKGERKGEKFEGSFDSEGKMEKGILFKPDGSFVAAEFKDNQSHGSAVIRMNGQNYNADCDYGSCELRLQEEVPRNWAKIFGQAALQTIRLHRRVTLAIVGTFVRAIISKTTQQLIWEIILPQ